MAGEKKITRERVNQIINTQDRVATNLEEIDKHTQEGRAFVQMENKQETRNEVDDINAILEQSAYEMESIETVDLKNGVKKIKGVSDKKESEIKKLQLTQEEIATLHQKKTADLAHLVLNENSKKDSSEMKDVKFYMEALVNAMEAARDKMAGEDAFNELQEAYQMAIAACDTYVYSDKKKDKNRMKLIRETWLDLMYEADVMQMLREDLAEGKLEGKTMGQVLHMSPREKDVVQRPKKKAKKKSAEKAPKSDPAAEMIKGIFSANFSFSKSITDKGTGAKTRAKQAENIKAFRDFLRKLTPGRVCAINAELFGKKVRILQDAENKLYVMNGHERVALDMTASFMATKIETDIMSNSVLYGKNISGDLMDDYKTDLRKKSGNRVTGSKAQIRQHLINFLCGNLKLVPQNFSGITREKIVEFADRLVSAQGEKNVDMETVKANLVKEIEDTAKAQSSRFVNGVELTELMEQDAERSAKEIQEKYSYKVNDQNLLETEDWTKEEAAVKELLADLIYATDTLIVDTNAEKPAEYILEVFRSHQYALTVLLKDKQKSSADPNNPGPDMLDTIMEKLCLNMVEGNENNLPQAIVGEMKKLRDKLHEKLENPADALNEEKTAGEIEKMLNSQSKGLMDAFGEAKTSMDAAVASACEMLQEDVTKMTDIVLPEVSEEEQREAEKVSSLKDIIANASKSTKGQGQFTRMVLKQYFGKASVLDKRSMLASMIRSGKKIKDLDEVKIKDTDECLIAKMEKEDEVNFKAFFGEKNKGLGLTGKDKEQFEEEKKTVLEKHRLKLERKAWAAEMATCHIAKYKTGFQNVNEWSEGTFTDEQLALIEEYKEVKKKLRISANHLGGLVKGAGSLLQKLMQGIPRDALPDELNEALRDVKSNLPPIPERVIRSQLLNMVDKSGGTVTKMEVVKSLGAASVAQTLLCKAYGPDLPPEGKEVVVKLLRPDAKNRVAREEKIMLEVAESMQDGGGMLATYKGQLETYKKELDLTLEAKNVELGNVYNGRFEGVESMKQVDLIAPSQSAMVVEKAPGVTLDSYIEELKQVTEEVHESFYVKNEFGLIKEDKFEKFNWEDVPLMIEQRNKLAQKINEAIKRRDHISNLCNAWLSEGIFKSGFYHGDLHAGNILINDEKATAIDYGNAVTLSKVQQENITRMTTAVGLQDTALFFESFQNILLEKDDPEFKAFYTKEVAQKLKTLCDEALHMGDDEEADLRLQVALIKAQEMGIKIPPEIFNFSQGELRLENSVNELNDAINGMKELLDRIENKRNFKTPKIDPVAIVQFETGLAKELGDLPPETSLENAHKAYMFALGGEVDAEEFKKEFLDKTKVEEDEEKGIAGVDKRKDFMDKYFGDMTGLKEQLEEEKIKLPGQKEKIPFFEAVKSFQQIVDAYFEKYKGEKPSQATKDEGMKLAASLCPMAAVNGVLDSFGGSLYLQIELQEALQNLDQAKANEILKIYTDAIPKVIKLEENKKKLNAGQDSWFFGKLNEEEQQELAEESLELFKSIHQYQGLNHKLFNEFKIKLTMISKAASDEMTADMAPMFAVKTEGVGEQLQSKYNEYREKEKEIYETELGDANETWKEKQGATDEMKAELKRLENEVLALYRKAAYLRQKEFCESMYSTKVDVKSYGFGKVLQDTVKQNWKSFAGNLGAANMVKVIAMGVTG